MSKVNKGHSNICRKYKYYLNIEQNRNGCFSESAEQKVIKIYKKDSHLLCKSHKLRQYERHCC